MATVSSGRVTRAPMSLSENREEVAEWVSLLEGGFPIAEDPGGWFLVVAAEAVLALTPGGTFGIQLSALGSSAAKGDVRCPEELGLAAVISGCTIR